MNKKMLSQKRQLRIRKKIRSTSDRLRLTVFRSNKYIYAQVIDDSSGKTVVGVSEKLDKKITGRKIERAKQLGLELAKLAKEKKVTAIAFDKGKYAFHGRVKAFAEGAREGGLQF